MARADGRRGNADLRTALIAIVLLAAYVRLLTRATTPVVTALSGLSSDSPLRYAVLLVFLVGLPGLLFTLPRALERRRAPIAPVAHSRAQLAVARMSHMSTDVLGVAAFLLAQVPLPAPWSVAGKAATIEAVTMSPQIVALSQRLGAWSIVVFAAGLVAAVIARAYYHAPLLRMLAIALVVGAPVITWAFVTRSVLS